jgi:phosphohistidine phosphatase SixA
MRVFRLTPALVIGSLLMLVACQGGQSQSTPVTPAAGAPTTSSGPGVGSPVAVVSPPPAASPAAVASPLASPAASPAAALVPSPSPPPSPAASAASPAPVAAASPSPISCEILLGFATLRDMVGEAVVGQCQEAERQIPSNGNAEQRTTNGLFVYRALDQHVLFVGATQTWINRGGNVVTRPNNVRLEWEGDRQLIETLRQGGHTIYFRHGPTDSNQRDTEPNNLANCATQRNLTDAGRDQARAIGEALRGLRIPVGQVLSSEYCRAREYSMLLFGREPEMEPSLVLPDPLSEEQRARNTEALTSLLAREPQAGTNRVMVSHSPNIRLAAGVDLPEEGGAAVLRLDGGTVRVVARVRPSEWTTWAEALRTP